MGDKKENVLLAWKKKKKKGFAVGYRDVGCCWLLR
jgi:hypothetical protein